MCTLKGIFCCVLVTISLAAVNPEAQAGDKLVGVTDAWHNGLKELVLDVENDSSWPGTDRYFTNATRLTLRTADTALYTRRGGEVRRWPCEPGEQVSALVDYVRDAAIPPGNQLEPAALKRKRCLVALDLEELKSVQMWTETYGYALANNMYTASDIRLTPAEFRRDDHPYGGWLYFSVFRERNYKNEAQDRIELDVGCIGPCSHSEDIQKWWHAVVNAPTPQGWSSQIGNEVAVQFIYQRRWPALALYGSATHNRDDTRYFDFAPTASLYAGNVFITAGGGFVARANIYRMKGYFDGHGFQGSSPKVSLLGKQSAENDDPNAEELNGKSESPSDDLRQSEAFAYVRAEVRAVGYNAMLQGRMFGGSDPFTQDPQRVIVDLEAGVAAHIGPCSVQLSYASRSTEVGLQEASLTRHRWRELKFAYSF